MERRPFEVPEYSIMLLTIRLPNGVAPKNTSASQSEDDAVAAAIAAATPALDN